MSKTVSQTTTSSPLKYTPTDAISKTVTDLRNTFNTGKTKALEWRIAQLYQLNKMVEENRDAFVEAVSRDLRKPGHETLLTEIGMIQSDITMALENLHDWVKPEYPPVDFINKFDKCVIRHEPLGVILIIGAWNYPVQLTLVPLIGAIAAGNCAVVKPSELAEHTAHLLSQLFPRYLDNSAFRIVNGAVTETTVVLEQPFDHIFYTGNGRVGRIIMAAASKNLTPVTLELGGKSPCIIDSTSDLEVVARRIVWGRFMNAGQTCIAPDYLLCSKSTQTAIIPHIKSALLEYYGEQPQQSQSLSRIINRTQFDRLAALIKNTSGELVTGGQVDEKENFIAPTVYANVKANDPLMKDEIFGPILPIVNVETVDEAVRFINEREKPLALYLFTKDNKVIDKVLDSTNSGGACVNDTLMHISVATLPFGGVGGSGMGGYHGKHTFDVFSHKRSVMVKKQALEVVNKLRYPPYTPGKLNVLGKLLFKTPPPLGSSGLKRIFFPVLKWVVLLALVGSIVARTNPEIIHHIRSFFVSK